MLLVGVVLIGLILWLRPTSDPLIVITAVSGFIASTGAGVLSMMKSQETHVAVNSRMDQWMDAQSNIAHAQGVSDEQARVVASLPVPVPVITVPPQEKP